MTTTRLASAVLGVAGLAISAATAQSSLPNGVAAGDTTQNSAVLWTRSTNLGNVSFEWSTDPNFGSIAGSANVNVTNPLQPVQYDVQGLQAGTQYYYRATDASGTSSAGRFRTHAQSFQATGLRFGVTGDWRGELAPYPAVRNVPGRNLDLFVGLGDTIYADYPSPALNQPQASTLNEFRTKHAEVYGSRHGLNTLADVRASTSWFATIDDHEVTNDFEGYGVHDPMGPFGLGGPAAGTRENRTPLFQNGLQAFREYNPIRATNYNTPGNDRFDGLPDLYRARNFGSAASFFMVDARSFRDVGLPAVSNPVDPAAVGAFVGATYTPGRTMLGNVQFERLKQDLMDSKNRGETWRFVMIPEPAQNLGVLNASDRFEGYAAERASLLRFINENNIPNVVFVAADIHGTLVNNLTYANGPGQPQITTNAFEITTGSLAFDAPFGPTVAGIAAGLGIQGALPLSTYNALPGAFQEQYIQGLINAQIQPLGYSPLGLADAPFASNVQLLSGGWTATNTYGWTEFDIDEVTQALTVTTYGTPFYTEAQLNANPALIAAMQPTIVQQFRVAPQFVPTPGAAGVAALGLLMAGRRRR